MITFVKPYMEKDGHLRVGINNDQIKCKRYIHQLVAQAFVDNPENKSIVHHKDGDELNNDYTNLMWVTDEEHRILTKNLNKYSEGKRGSLNSSSKYSDSQIRKALMLLEENKLYLLKEYYIKLMIQKI